jgi:hypothetical protein
MHAVRAPAVSVVWSFPSQPEQLSDLRHRVLWILDTMADRSRILEDLVVVAALESLVAEEVDCGVFHSSRQVLLVLDVLETIPLVPTHWEDVEGDLAADRVSARPLAVIVPLLGKS